MKWFSSTVAGDFLPTIAPVQAGPAMSPRLRRLRLRRPRQFVAEWVVLVLGLTILGAMLAWSQFRALGMIEATERDRLRVQARVIDENVGQQLVGINRALVSVRDEFSTTPVHSVSTLISTRLKALSDAIPGVRSMVLLDADGTVAASSVDTLLGRDFTDREYFRASRDRLSGATLHVAAPYKTSLGGHTVVFARTVTGSNGAFAGAVAAALEPEYFEVLLRSVLYAPDMWVAVGHADGKVFVTMPPDPGRTEGDWQKAVARQAGLDHEPGATPVIVGSVGPNEKGDVRLTALRTLDPEPLHMDKPLVITVSRSLTEVIEPWRRQSWAYALFFVVLGGGAGIGLNRGQWRRRALVVLEASAAADRQKVAEQLGFALQGADLGLWDWDLRDDRFEHNEVVFRQLGYAAGEVGPRGTAWRDLLHPDDKARHLAAIEAHLGQETVAYECEFRVRHKSGHWVWLLSRGKVVERDGDGRPLRMSGTHMDLTRRKEAEAQMERSTQMLRRTGELGNIGGWELDLATQRVEWTEQMYRLHEIEPGTVLCVRDALEFYAAEARPQIEAAVAAGTRDGTRWDLELPFLTAGGNPRWVRTQGVPVVEHGKVVRLTGAFQDITEKKMVALEMQRLNEQLVRLSTTDALTEVGNRRLFDQTLKSEWLRAARRSEALGLLMIDIDHFKEYNDHYGHPVGDACLRKVARIVSASVRRGGELVARYGGEEFALLLPGADLEAARQVAEHCMAKVDDARIEHEGSPSGSWLSVSIGVASQVAAAAVDASVLLESADAALYRAKRCGRGRVEF